MNTTPLTLLPVIDFLKIIFPEDMHRSVMIAGGAAYDFEKATDVDVFIATKDCKKTVERIRQFIPNLCSYDRDGVFYSSNMSVIADGMLEVESAGVCKPIQFIGVLNNDRVEDILQTFDITLHAVGYRLDGESVESNSITEIRLRDHEGEVHWSSIDAVRTLHRMLKFHRRYNLPVNADDVVYLLRCLQPALMSMTEPPIDCPF